MKNIFKIFVLITLCQLSYGQSASIFRLSNTPKVIFVEFGSPEFVGKDFDLLKKMPDGTFKNIASLEAPDSENQLKRRIASSESVFVIEARPSTKNINDTWKRYKEKKGNLYNFIAYIPQLEYLFGLAFLDTDVRPNEKYQYQLVEKSLKIATSEVFSRNNYTPMPQLLMSNTLKKGNTIEMNFSYPEEMQFYSIFLVKRKLFSEKNASYKPINPLVNFTKNEQKTTLSISDTSLVSSSAYNYQIRIGDIFGNVDSTIYHFEANNLPPNTGLLPENVTIQAQKESRSLKLSWTISQNKIAQNIRIFRSRDFDKNFKLIANLNPNETSYEDPIDIANEHYHYYFEIIDLFGNTSKSIKYKGLYDEKYAPQRPIDLNVKTLKKGVELSWQGTDPHTRGFYVFRKNGQNGDFIQISEFISSKRGDAQFIDLSTLDEGATYYYAVKTESDTYDKSGFSEPVSFKPQSPEHINKLKPPHDITAVFRNDRIIITWENMNSEISQTLGYQVFRKSNSETTFRLLTETPLSFNNNIFEDSIFLSKEKYQYVIVSTNLQGEFSAKSQPVSIDLAGKFIVVPENLGIEIQTNGLKLKWTEIEAKKIKSIKIYRAEENSEFRLLTTTSNFSREYNDNTVQKGKSYLYRIATIDLNNQESNMSDPILINF
jgi:fibronectin type 3 domain-containing protein